LRIRIPRLAGNVLLCVGNHGSTAENGLCRYLNDACPNVFSGTGEVPRAQGIHCKSTLRILMRSVDVGHRRAIDYPVRYSLTHAIKDVLAISDIDGSRSL